MKKILLTFLSLLIGISTIYADTLKKEWEKTWGGNDDSYFVKLFEYQNNYYVFGHTFANNIIDVNEYAVLDYDKLGNLVYQIGVTDQIFHYDYYSLGNSIIGLSTYNKIIFKVDSQFRLDKQVTYGDENYTLVQYKIVNNKFYVQGITNNDKTIVKIYDENLNEEIINNDDYYLLLDLVLDNNGDFIASVIKKETTEFSLHLMKYSNKKLVWDKEIRKITNDEIDYESIFFTSSSDYFINKLYAKNNYIYSYSFKEEENKIINTINVYDKDGNLVKEINLENIDELPAGIILKYFIDKDDKIVAYMHSSQNNNTTTYAIKYDSNGKILWKINTLTYNGKIYNGTYLSTNVFENNIYELGNGNVLINVISSEIDTIKPVVVNSTGEIIWNYEGSNLLITGIAGKNKSEIILLGMTKELNARGSKSDTSQSESSIPDAVIIKYSISYNVRIEEEGKGVVDVDTITAKSGDIVKIDAKPDKGYRVGEIIVTDSNGNIIDVKDNKFIMPSSDVTVKVIFTNTPVENPKTGFMDLTIILVVVILLSTIVYKYIKNNLLVKNL